MIEPSRIKPLNNPRRESGDFVLYWMQASQREQYNHALEFAAEQANARSQPLVVVFGLTDEYPEANERHYAFMLQGLSRTRRSLADRGVQMVVLHRSPPLAALELEDRASLLVTDRGYLRFQKRWRQQVAREAACPVIQVETDAVVPVQTASRKEEYSAATLRRKIHENLPVYLRPLRRTPLRRDSLGLGLGGMDLSDPEAVLAGMKIDRSVRPVRRFVGGTGCARRLLRRFIRLKLKDYADKRGDASLDIQSHMSPYLHFGQISPLEVALEVLKARGVSRANKDAYLEELIVRRELAINFVHYNRRYDSFLCLATWARTTLQAHARDKRPYVYSLQELEQARTHDPYWNAAMREMACTGKMHNYMRMYWGKKILEWTRSPRTAFRVALRLNNKYFLDGRDPNSYAGVAWCFGKHDRPWPQREIFGTVRYMAASGLERKFDADAYVRQVEQLCRAEGPPGPATKSPRR